MTVVLRRTSEKWGRLGEELKERRLPKAYFRPQGEAVHSLWGTEQR